MDNEEQVYELINNYIQNAEFDIGLTKIDELNKDNSHSAQNSILFVILKARCIRWQRIGDAVNRGYSLISPILPKIQEFSSNSITKIIGLVEYVYFLWWKNEFDEMGDIINQIENEFELYTPTSKSLENKKDIIVQSELATLIRIKGMTSYRLGKYSIALQELLQSKDHRITINEEADYSLDFAVNYYTIAYIYLKMGLFKESKEYYNKTLNISKDINYKQGLAWCQHGLGIIDFYRGKYASGEILVENGLHTMRGTGEYFLSSEYLFELVQICVNQDLNKRAAEYCETLQDISDNYDNKIVNQHYQLAYASILMTKGLKEKAKALDIYTEIVNDEIVNFELTLVALKQYCVLLIIEYKLSQHQSDINKINDLLNRLDKYALDNNITPLQIEILIIKSKFSLANFNLQQARNHLVSAQKLSNGEFGYLYNLVQIEIKKIDERFEQLKTIHEDNQELFLRFEKVDLLDYLERTQIVMRNMNLEEINSEE